MLKLPAYLTGFGSKSDGSAGLRFSTQELSAEQFSELKTHLNAFGWLVFAEAGVKDSDVPKEIVEDKDKTPSKRLRSTLFVYWKEKVNDGDFDKFYRSKVEAFIETIKEKLE